ncbi:MAG: DNA-directed polymerase PolC [Planctomycetota bacterium]|nr:DNA-directed polymerase PolC [Planctomycetota bacterium]
MSGRPFVHLHCHSHYSLLDGASKVPALVKKAKDLGMPALAITDHGNLHGAAEFLREAKNLDFKPIVGIEAYVAPRHRTDRAGGGHSGTEHNFHLTLLAKTGEGVRNLMRLSSKSFLEGFYYKPRIDKEILERHSEGLICLSGCVSSEFSDHLLHDKPEEAAKLAAWYLKVFGPENFFVEIQNNNVQIQRDHAERAVDLARKMGLPLVATSDAHYLNSDDAKAHDVLLCVNMGKTFDDPNRMRFESEEFHVRSPEEMYAAMPEHAEALKRSAEIAEGVEDHYKSLNFGKRQFPSFKTPEGKTPETYLRELCEQGMIERYGQDPSPEARDRLEHELGIIERMGFASYFLIVWDFVRFARENNIASSARGSACGAIVSYVLHLSQVCPLKYDLLFERFLDPNRSEAPDIDIDIEQDRRYEVIDYVRKKYGAGNVAQIGTFLTMGAKAAVKDVGRVLNIPLARVEQVTKLIPSMPLHITIEAAIKAEPALKRLQDEDPDIQKLLDYAKRLEGLARNVSTHAAGVVIADRPLEEMVPLQKLPNKDKEKEVVSTQWTMGDVEKAGLLKMDFLGLRNLSSLGAAVGILKERFPDRHIDLNNLPLDDPKTYELLQRGETKGVFQFESAGIRDLLIKMKPDRFADIIATSALYRPGPLNGGMVDEYVNVKNRRKAAEYPHPVLKELLEETYGVMVYQEQVMRILNRLGGIELSQAYGCIKAISKKKTDVIAQGRKQFLEGAVSQGMTKAEATQIFDLIEFFGGYGFNKSHSTAYALVTFQTAWLKAHYPTEFMAAILSSEMDGAERDKFFYEHIDDCKRMGIEILPPNVNASGLDFRPAADGKIHFGLGAIKGVGYKAVEAILKARASGGVFRSLDDFFERVPTAIVGQGCVETLIKAGAFDCLKARRAQLLAVLPRAVQAGQARQNDRKRGQRGLFDESDSDEPEIVALSLPDVPELPDAEKLADEKKALGFYMSSHPLARHAMLLQAFRSHQTSDLAGLSDKAEVTLGGMISGLTVRNVQKSRSGLTRMAKLSFEDLSGSTPAMLWPEEFAKNEDKLKDDAIVFIKGTISRMRDPAEVIINRVIPIEQAAAELSRGVVVSLRKGAVGPADFEKLHRHMKNRTGNLEVYLELLSPVEGVRRAIYKVGSGLKIRHDEKLVADLESTVGSGNVRLLGQGGATSRAEPAPPPENSRPEFTETAPEEDED